MPGALRAQLRQGRVQAPRDSPMEHTAEGGQLGPGQEVRGNQLETTSGQCPILSLSPLLAVLIPACASSSPTFLMMYSAYESNKHPTRYRQPWLPVLPQRI